MLDAEAATSQDILDTAAILVLRRALAALLKDAAGVASAAHVHAAVRNGLTPAEIAEVLMHTANYAGLPAANAAVAVAQRLLQEEG
jgi:alkylhydroperoxidase/carboxymuconolactone decarboxylase family protein YurZ